MDRDTAQMLAVKLLEEHGLDGWTFRWSRAVRQFGACNYSRREIRLSGPITDRNGIDAVEETIRHEIAHALAGPGAGHGPRWVKACAVAGAKPERCYSGDEVDTPRGRWTGSCPTPTCDFELNRHRLTRAAKNGACPRCCRRAGGFDPRFRLIWTDTALARA